MNPSSCHRRFFTEGFIGQCSATHARDYKPPLSVSKSATVAQCGIGSTQGGGKTSHLGVKLFTGTYCNFFFFLHFDSGLSMVYFKENYKFPRFQRVSNIFQGGGGPTFSRGGSNFFQGRRV